jgi:hypothetical protein
MFQNLQIEIHKYCQTVDSTYARQFILLGENDEWPIWSEKLFAKAKRSGFKDVLLGKVNIPKANEEINEKTEEGRILMKKADIDAVANTH